MRKCLLIIATILIFSSAFMLQSRIDQLQLLCDKQKEVLKLDQQVINSQLVIIDILDIQVATQIKYIDELESRLIVVLPITEEN